MVQVVYDANSRLASGLQAQPAASDAGPGAKFKTLPAENRWTGCPVPLLRIGPLGIFWVEIMAVYCPSCQCSSHVHVKH